MGSLTLDPKELSQSQTLPELDVAQQYLAETRDLTTLISNSFA